ncbi:MAG: hypothetical protein A3K77_01385 [Euryarchaeota archaeon RBG_13_31_8]|nr:MAG: hypothetical protein A3K77_01385 [Euryarchaeota archaeon RBG_13_31_8]
MYDNILEEGHETTPRDVAKYFPNKDKMMKKIASPRDLERKRKMGKSKARRKSKKGCGCK